MWSTVPPFGIHRYWPGGGSGHRKEVRRPLGRPARTDVFEQKLNKSYETLSKKFASQCEVPRERQFVGFNAFQQLIDSGVDVVLLCTTPAFRPAHLRYAVEKKKHI